MKFVDKQLAIKLKEKGFDRPCLGFYNPIQDELQLYCANNKDVTYKNILTSVYKNKVLVDAPTIEQVLEWLREKDIVVYCTPYHAMATKNHIMYEWNVGVFNVDTKETKEDNKIVYLTCVDNDYGYVRYCSFDCFANYDDAILAGVNFVVEHLI